MRIFLMETPKKLFDLQMDASLEPVRKTEAAIKGGAFAVKDTENTYQPKGIPNRITVQ